MDLNLVRERASALHTGAIQEPEYLQELVEFIVRNKKHLPEHIAHSLHEAFGKQKRTPPLRNRQDALSRVRCLTKEDIKTPEYLSDAVSIYKEKGYLFWSGEASSSAKVAFRNVLADLYYANKRSASANSVRRAFYCVALYRVLQRVIELHQSKTFTEKVASLCADMIIRDSEDGKIQKVDIIRELRSDLKTGGVYDQYAQKEGSGILFYLFVLPSTLYEKYLNKSKDVNTVLEHYESIGFRLEPSIISAAASIMGVISDRFNSQVSIFKVESAPHHLIKPTRKRGRRPESSARQSSKKSKNPNQVGASKTAHVSCPGGSLVALNRSSQGNGIGVDSLGSLNTDVLFPPLEASDYLNESIPQVGSLVPVDDAEGSQTSTNRDFIPVGVPTTEINVTRSDPLALSMNIPSNAANLMDGFELESLIDEINAAQLMQQFDLFNGWV